MTAELTHEQASDELEAVALGIATEEVAQGVTAHAVRCAECTAELRSFYNIVTALSALIPQRQLNRGHSAGIKSRLLAKATAGREGSAIRRAPHAEPSKLVEVRAPAAKQLRVEEAPAVAVPDRARAPMWVAAIATLIAVGAVAALLRAGNEGGIGQRGSSEAPGDEVRMAELERLIGEKEATIASLSGPGVRIISLFNREAREPLGRMFWDRRRDRWTLFVYTLRQPRAGKIFQVWLGTDNGRVPLGTFQPASDGTAIFTAAHALAITALNTVSISEENTGGRASAPTGPVVLAGALR